LISTARYGIYSSRGRLRASAAGSRQARRSSVGSIAASAVSLCSSASGWHWHLNAEHMNAIATSPLFKKLNLGVHQEITVLNAPDSFESELKLPQRSENCARSE